jgi:ABC-type sugar transport system ATPase subunit
MASVTLNNVQKSFGETHVLHEVSLEIKDREFLVLVGPSGCGKSTLLRMIAGLEEISSGQISIGGKIVNDLPPRDREIAMVFQDYALYPHLTVEENLSFGLKLRRMPADEIRKRVDEAAQILQIGNLLKRRPRALSGGQRQRVAIGRAIVRKPKVFLFDEPLSNLDAKLREEMRVELAKLHQRLETTIIYVTHDQVEAMTLGSRMVVLNAGYVQQVGTPIEVFTKPSNRFVAGFIGSPTMNFLQGDLEGSAFKVGGVQIKMPAHGHAPREVTLGVRPEDIRIGSGDVPAKIEIVELLGSRKHVYLDVGGSRMTVSVDSSFNGNQGETVKVGFQPEKMHLFETNSGKRV